MDGYRFMFYHSLYLDNNFVSSMTTCNLIHCIRSPGINGRDQVDRTQETKGRGSSRREYILTEKGRSVMTQTVKKRAAILLLFAIAVASLFYLSTLPGEFLITSRSNMDEESHDFSETILRNFKITRDVGQPMSLFFRSLIPLSTISFLSLRTK